ncbi:MAG: hypothetical protein A2178_02775 [Planctomycetes bacterium GWC2_49_10]|nr:MAG: hypothetical protein A2178_02775 [Planctomycetes bacterium GWC2_49_10]
MFKAFGRILPYITPQWPRITIILVTALINAILFSTTIATIIPLLKVLMGQEGLHGWVDRNITSSRYNVSFYVPDKQDLSNDPNVNYLLKVIGVKEDDAAYKAGIRGDDRITNVWIGEQKPQKQLATEMLAIMASADDGSKLNIDVKRFSLTAIGQQQLVLTAAKKPEYFAYAQKALTFVPRTTTSNDKINGILFIVCVMTLVTGIRCSCRFLQDYTGDKVMHTAVAQIREQSFAHALNMPVGFFSKQGSSDTVSRLVQDTGTVGGGIKTLLTKTIREPFTAIAMLAFAFILSPKLSLAFLFSAPLVIIAISNFGKKIKRATKKSLANWAKILGKLEETIIALKVVKIYNRQPYEHQKFHNLNQSLLKQQFRIAKTDAATDPMMEFLGMIALAGCIFFGARWALASGEMTTFFGVLVLLGGAANAIRRTSDVWNRINQSNAAAERVFAIIDQPLEIQSPNAVELRPFKSNIDFRNIHFTYPGADRPVLKGIDLNVRAGQTVAVVGPNGSGKTTLINLIPRFYDPDNGTILIDGQNTTDVTLASLRNQMGMVTQNVLTFNDTIAANIAYGKPDATMAEITEAAKRSYAHEFIEPMTDGYNTIIGEQGAGLSGGQLQRIVIARAILKNPPIMIFDEAMSQIDADSEAKIHRALDAFMKNRTAFVIAHRFSTVIKADMIVVMQDGRIIAKGVHDDLIKSCALYQSLYQTQLLKD